MVDSPRNILTAMRHQHCDCLLEVRQKGTADAPEAATPTHIMGHRAILARTTYFASLFRHTEPDRVDRHDADGARICRSAYALEVPFSVDSLAFLVECLYDDIRLDSVVDTIDPVDVMHAALFVGMPKGHAPCLLRRVLYSLLDSMGGRGSSDDGEAAAAAARAQLACFVRHMLASDFDPSLKTCLLGRVVSLLEAADREAIAADYPDLMPERYYRPLATVGDVVTDPVDGRRWRRIRLAMNDMCTYGKNRTIEWDGLVFSMDVTSSSDYGVVEMVEMVVRCSTEKGAAGAPDIIDARPRAMRIVEASVYDPTGPGSVDYFHTRSYGGVCKDAAREQMSRYEAGGRSVPKGARLVPDPIIARWDNGHLLGQSATVECPSAEAFDDQLSAYEVDLCVEELD